jgi:hypothetical protein
MVFQIVDPNSKVNEIGEEENEISTIQSVLAGIGSGLFKIPEGFVSLGATLMDLGADTNKAAEVEEYFAKINPFDEMAEATTAGKITELITNLAIPGGVAFKAGSSLAKGALAAKKGGKYLNVTGNSGKNLAKGIRKKIEPELNAKGKAISFGVGAGAGGVAEGIFVGDVEDAGTFGDLIGGPTELDRGLEGTEYDPSTELLNRLKFGTEGALFTGLLGGAGLGIRKLRDSTNAGRATDGKLNRWLDKWISQPLRARGKETQPQFLIGRTKVGSEAADTNTAETIVRELDGSISKLFPFFKRVVGDKTVDGKRRELLAKMNKVLLSSSDDANKLKPIYKSNAEGIESIGFGNMNKKLAKEFTDDLKKLGAKKEDIDGIFDNLNAMRLGWGQLFSSMGKRLDADGAKEFKNLFGNKVTTWLDSTYDVFKNRKSKLGEMYTPSKEVMDAAKVSFKQLYRKNTGKTLSDAAAQQQVLRVYNSAKIEKGFKLNTKSDPYFKLPEFFVAKSSADDVFKMTDTRMAELTKSQREVIEKLFGKGDDAFQTILNGTHKLSAIVRRNEYFDNLLNESNRLREAGQTPIFANNADEAAKIFGGVEGVDWKAVTPVVKTKKGVKGLEAVDPNLDYKQTLRPLKGERKPTFRAKDAVKGEIDMELPIHNPLQTKYALAGNVDSIVKPVDELANSNGFLSQIYQNLILYPKATSQMAKTILSPFTHGRNFLSAGAFAAANGIIPFADREAVAQAYQALQVKLPGARRVGKLKVTRRSGETDAEFAKRQKSALTGNEFYQKLLKLGVVNSQVQLGDLQNLLKDVKFGGVAGTLSSGDNVASYGLNRLLKTLSKVKKFSEDAYTAEDDFWKIFSYLGESKRLRKAYDKAGVKLGQKFTDMNGNTVRLTDELIDEQAADIIRNNIPNYAYVSEFVKGLRKLPLGNFVSFPAEIMRTSTNIVSRALDEIFYSTTVNGKQVNPFRTIGLQRLAGMTFTTAAVPSAAVAGMSALYDVTREEREAIRRYVADWSKNSVLLPLRGKDGKLKYIDFSHMNAYDTVTRPIQTILNRVQAGEQDKDGMMDDFIMGMVESTKELGSPFISESIWTEALSDLFMRGGRTREGFKVWNPEDTTGTKMSKGVAHLIQSQAPLNWKQLKRIGLSMKPVDDVGRFDDRGREYELGNEVAGIIGARAIEVEPEKAIKYKVADYLRGARDSRSLFSTVVLRGGVVEPKDVVDAYINANRALFLNQKELYKDLEAAKVLKGDQSEIVPFVAGKIGKKNYGAIQSEQFVPYIPSRNVFIKSQQIAEELGVPNSLVESMGAIMQIRSELFNVGLEDEFPEIDNPLDIIVLPDLVGQVNTMIGNNPTNAALAAAPGTTGFVGQTNVNIDPVTKLSAAEEIYLDPTEKVYRKNQRTNTRLT